MLRSRQHEHHRRVVDARPPRVEYTLTPRGRRLGAVVDGTVKRSCLLAWAAERAVPLTRTVGVGDGANDLGMMAAAALSVAFDAKPAVRAAASVVLPERDLSRVLPLLGLPRQAGAR